MPFAFDEGAFEVLGTSVDPAGLSDIEIGERLDSPIGTDKLETLVAPGDSVLFVVPDATRRTACGQIINLLVRRLIANGTGPSDMRIIFATGIHRAVTEAEKREILTPFISQRIKTLDHNPRDLMQIARLGKTTGGIPIELNRALVEHDHVILIGGITFHYFAGFTGGRKLICPGLALSKTVSATHKLAFDCERKTRREGVGTARLDGNAVHEAFVEAASAVKTSFAVNTIVNDAGVASEIYCGDWIESHRAACNAYAAANSVRITEKRDVIIASCGGFPYDINLIQAHKALEAASHACVEGGTIVLLAECSEGTGRSDFLDWFSASTSAELADRLCEKYQVNGQTGWNFLRIAERFDVRLVTSLPDDVVARLRCIKASDASSALSNLEHSSSGYIIPAGARFHIQKL
jgi:nickel-dependent lactate racemase